MSIQVAILKVLASHDSGRATTASLKRDIAILATSGPEWSARMRRLAGRVRTIDILASGHVLWDGDGWQITAEGRDFLRALEAVTQDNRLARGRTAVRSGRRRRRRAPACGADRRRSSVQEPPAPCSGVAGATAFSGEARRRGLTRTCASARLCAHAHHPDPRPETFDCADRGLLRQALAGRPPDEPARRQPVG